MKPETEGAQWEVVERLGAGSRQRREQGGGIHGTTSTKEHSITPLMPGRDIPATHANTHLQLCVIFKKDSSDLMKRGSVERLWTIIPYLLQIAL